MFNLWKAIDQEKSLVHLMKIMIFLLIMVIMFLSYGLIKARENIKIFIPPDLNQLSIVKPNEIRKADVYLFAYSIWQSINTWPKNGEEDYFDQINRYQHYLTKEFKTLLLKEAKALKKSDQLRRERYAFGINGKNYKETKVVVLNKTSWGISIEMKMNEWINDLKVKDVSIAYKLKVVRSNLSEEMNPFGLMLDGFLEEPVRIKI